MTVRYLMDLGHDAIVLLHTQVGLRCLAREAEQSSRSTEPEHRGAVPPVEEALKLTCTGGEGGIRIWRE